MDFGQRTEERKELMSKARDKTCGKFELIRNFLQECSRITKSVEHLFQNLIILIKLMFKKSL